MTYFLQGHSASPTQKIGSVTFPTLCSRNPLVGRICTRRFWLTTLLTTLTSQQVLSLLYVLSAQYYGATKTERQVSFTFRHESSLGFSPFVGTDGISEPCNPLFPDQAWLILRGTSASTQWFTKTTLDSGISEMWPETTNCTCVAFSTPTVDDEPYCRRHKM